MVIWESAFRKKLESSKGYLKRGLCAPKCCVYIQEMIAFCLGEYEIQHWQPLICMGPLTLHTWVQYEGKQRRQDNKVCAWLHYWPLGWLLQITVIRSLHLPVPPFQMNTLQGRCSHLMDHRILCIKAFIELLSNPLSSIVIHTDLWLDFSESIFRFDL